MFDGENEKRKCANGTGNVGVASYNNSVVSINECYSIRYCFPNTFKNPDNDVKFTMY